MKQPTKKPRRLARAIVAGAGIGALATGGGYALLHGGEHLLTGLAKSKKKIAIAKRMHDVYRGVARGAGGGALVGGVQARRGKRVE